MSTFFRYLARTYLQSLGFAAIVLLSIVFLINLVELLRRSAKRSDTGLVNVLEMALYQVPTMTIELAPFIVLFGTIWCFTRLARSHELVVARAAGLSAWQFLLPPLIVTLLLGTATVTAISPIAASMAAEFERLEARHLKVGGSPFALSSNGVWLRQGDADGQSVIHAADISAASMEMHQAIIFRFRGEDSFFLRIDANKAQLRDGYWELQDVIVTKPDQIARRYDTYRLETQLTRGRIEESFASPQTLSFWALPGFIDMLQTAGFSAIRHQIYWHSLFALPVLLCGLVLVAAAFAIRSGRHVRIGLLAASAVTMGFALFFLSDIVQALGSAGKLPIQLAAWTPALVALMAGAAMVFHFEDG